ncbi:MAG: cytidine deaminase [Lachnospiraceae bacterium]|nr:cytidine deaminase [Lachnospiraceae bacterium]
MNKYEHLIQEAFAAKEFAYVPYSKFRVGAALLAKNGRIFKGCNIENASFTPTNCAERTAFFKAISEGVTEFEAIVVCGDQDQYLAPCGVCRQVMAEFCDLKEFQVILAKSPEDYKVLSLEELFPYSFTKENL